MQTGAREMSSLGVISEALIYTIKRDVVTGQMVRE